MLRKVLKYSIKQIKEGFEEKKRKKKACVPGRGLKAHMNWHNRNATVPPVQQPVNPSCGICGRVARSPSALLMCERSNGK